MFEHYIRSGKRLLRCGFTTGTCAGLAAGGAAELLLTGKAPEKLEIITPKGLKVDVKPAFCRADGPAALCGVVKDAGDDSDVTDGMTVTAALRKTDSGITIDGGEGVGRVTKPGLDQPVGEAAINRVPRQMIEKEVRRVCDKYGYTGGISVVVSVPGGEEAARRTFNPMLGIEGGISILGTSGIVEPMSEQALIDTIEIEMRQTSSFSRRLILTPGNYGMDYIRKSGWDESGIPIVKCSNFIGDAIDIAAGLDFEQILLVGHVGKLVKLAGGVMNTHSRYADCRAELICAHAAIKGAGTEVCRALMECVTVDGCIQLLDRAGLRRAVMDSLMTAIQKQLDRRAEGAVEIGALVFSNEYGLLGMTETGGRLVKGWFIS